MYEAGVERLQEMIDESSNIVFWYWMQSPTPNI